jgi:glycerophosphoryl diester phosphodiesterase
VNSQHIAPLVIAHRGARAFAPENTLQAFQKAAQLGADMVELDVQCTADGQLVAVHDDTLERCSNVCELYRDRSDYRVQSFTLSEIRGLDAGSWFVRELERQKTARQPFLQSLLDDELQRHISAADRALYASGHVRLPTLVESLMQCRDLGLRVNIELKASHATSTLSDTTDCEPVVGNSGEMKVSDALIVQVVQQVGGLGIRDDVLISSFDHGSLNRVKQIEPALRTGVLVTHPVADPVAYCRDLRASAYHPGCSPGDDAVGFGTDEFRATGRLAAEPFRSLLAAGIAVYVWTENDPTRMLQLIDAGVSGIFTDYPNRLAAIVRGAQ